MLKEKMKQAVGGVKQNLSETFKLLWQFKWSMLIYLLFYMMFVAEYLDPPAEDDPILQYEYSRGAWNYINREVYVGSMWNTLVELFLFFIIGTSNMRNHPKLAQLIFLSPIIIFFLGLIVGIAEEIIR